MNTKKFTILHSNDMYGDFTAEHTIDRKKMIGGVALLSLSIKGSMVRERSEYTISLQRFHFNNATSYLGISEKELLQAGSAKVVSTSAQQALEEWLRNHKNVKRDIEGRLKYTS